MSDDTTSTIDIITQIHFATLTTIIAIVQSLDNKGLVSCEEIKEELDKLRTTSVDRGELAESVLAQISDLLADSDQKPDPEKFLRLIQGGRTGD